MFFFVVVVDIFYFFWNDTVWRDLRDELARLQDDGEVIGEADDDDDDDDDDNDNEWLIWFDSLTKTTIDSHDRDSVVDSIVSIEFLQ